MPTFARTQQVLDDWQEYIVRQAKLNLGARQLREGKRTIWKKGLGQWIPLYTHTRIYYRSYDVTGRLRNSVRGTSDLDVTDYETVGKVKIETHYYGEYVDKGRPAKWDYIPNKDLKEWIRDRNIMPRDLNNMFRIFKRTKERIESLSFLINRKIKYHGIPASNFLTEPAEKSESIYPDKFAHAYAMDAIEQVVPEG